MDDSIRNEIEAKHRAAMQALIEEKEAAFIKMRAAHQAQKEALEEEHSKTRGALNDRLQYLQNLANQYKSERDSARSEVEEKSSYLAERLAASSNREAEQAKTIAEMVNTMFTKDQAEALVSENTSALAAIKDLQTQVTNAKAAALDAENRSKIAIEQAAAKLEQGRIVMDNRIAKAEQDAAAKVAEAEKKMSEMANHPDVRKAKIKSLKEQLATLS